MLPSGKRGPSRQSPKSPHRRPPIKPAEQALIIFTKAPIPGEVKTRLCPPLSDDEAASLHGSLVMDVLERCNTLTEFDRYIAGTPSVDHAFFKTMAARYNLQLQDQVGENLGLRMDRAITKILNNGYRYGLLVGTDLPTFSAHVCRVAIKMLADHDVVFGPTSDGGYYLVGMKHPAPELFHDIPWSTGSVLSESLKKAHGSGLTVGQLEQLEDLDSLEDLALMVTLLKGPLRKRFSTRTANVLLTLAKRHLRGTNP